MNHNMDCCEILDNAALRTSGTL